MKRQCSSQANDMASGDMYQWVSDKSLERTRERGKGFAHGHLSSRNSCNCHEEIAEKLEESTSWRWVIREWNDEQRKVRGKVKEEVRQRCIARREETKTKRRHQWSRLSAVPCLRKVSHDFIMWFQALVELVEDSSIKIMWRTLASKFELLMNPS